MQGEVLLLVYSHQLQQLLQQQLAVEQANPGPGVERVIADIERSLQRLP